MLESAILPHQVFSVTFASASVPHQGIFVTLAQDQINNSALGHLHLCPWVIAHDTYVPLNGNDMPFVILEALLKIFERNCFIS